MPNSEGRGCPPISGPGFREALLSGYLAQRVPSLFLASSFRRCSNCAMYVSLEDTVPIKPVPWGVRPRCGAGRRLWSDKGEVLLRGVGTLRYFSILGETLLVKCPSVQWQPDGLRIHAKKWFLGAGFLGAPPMSLIWASHEALQWCGKKGVAVIPKVGAKKEDPEEGSLLGNF